jgi:hypothetical protein
MDMKIFNRILPNIRNRKIKYTNVWTQKKNVRLESPFPNSSQFQQIQNIVLVNVSLLKWIFDGELDFVVRREITTPLPSPFTNRSVGQQIIEFHNSVFFFDLQQWWLYREKRTHSTYVTHVSKNDRAWHHLLTTVVQLNCQRW